jgi:hypothetical protein
MFEVFRVNKIEYLFVFYKNYFLLLQNKELSIMKN